MARKRTLGTYENQARLSVALAVVGGVAGLAAIALLIRNFDPQTKYVAYSRETLYLPLLGAALLFSLVAGVAGLGLGFNSAGQRRNERSRLSWLGFFLCAGVITIALCAGIFFVLTKYAMR